MRTNLNEEMRLYLKEVSKTRVLTREEEVNLFVRLRSGDESAREIIVESNLRFVIKIALAYAGRGVPVADLVQEGNVGLLEVIDKFDYKRGYRFSTYAAFWIRQAVQLAVRRQANLIRLPIRKSRFLGHLNETIRDYTQAYGRTPTVHELAPIVEMDAEKLGELMQLRDSVLSLDAEPESDGNILLNTLRDENALSPYEHCVDTERHKILDMALDNLSEKERKVIGLRYGFLHGRNLSLRSTSKVVGMSQEGVRRVERKALSKLRRPTSRELVCGLV